MAWAWDPRKDVANQAKHGVSFALARLVFEDPLHLSQPDPFPDEERWQTLGMVGPACLFVVHTIWSEGAEPGGRIISARRAMRQERRWYEEGA